MTSGDTFRFSNVFSIELVLVPRWTESLPSEGIWETLSTPHVGKWHGNKEERARQTGSEDAEICFYNFYDTHPERRRDWAVKSSRQKGSRQKRHLQGYCGVRSLLVVSRQRLARTHNPFFTVPWCPLTTKQQPLVNLRSLFYVVDTRCQMAMLHHHEHNTANITGRSINEATLHRSVFVEVFFFFLTVFPRVPCLWATNKTTAASHTARRALRLTLLRPEPSCGGRDLEAAVTRALDVARFPVGTKKTLKPGLVLKVMQGFKHVINGSARPFLLA